MTNQVNKPRNTIKVESSSEDIVKQKKSNKKVAISTKKTEDLKKTLGLFLILLSVFMLLAFTSYFMSWREDQSIATHHGAVIKSVSEDNPEMAHNWMRTLGAALANTFIFNWFGIASYLFVLIFFVSGYRLFFGLKLRSVGKLLVSSFLLIFWISIVCGLTLQNVFDGLFGGTFGLAAGEKLSNLLGFAGTLMLLAFLLIAYLMIVYSLPVPETLKNVVAKRTAKPSSEFLSDDLEDSVEMRNEIVEKEFIPDDLEFNIKSKDETEPNQNVPVEIAPDYSKIGFEVEKPVEEDLSGVIVKDNYKKEQNENVVTDELPDYKFPTLDLLKVYEEKDAEVSPAELEERKNLIIQTLRNYSIEIDKIKATVGPTVTLYEIVPAAGVRISKIRNLEDDIALSLAALGIRIIAPIPGKGTIGIEVPNKKPEIVSIRSVIASSKFQHFDKELPIALGKTISNEVYVADLAKMPHLLIAGATGQGKSVAINVIITSLLFKKHPSQVRFVMIDPKKVELSIYQRIEKHFLAKLPNVDSSIITDIRDVVQTLNSLIAEMEERMVLFNLIPVRHITEYNAKFNSGQLPKNSKHRFLPYIILIIDELADLMLTAGKEVEMPIARLAQVARAFGIHLIISTQRPSVNIITGTIKANFPARLALKVVATVDSRTILDHKGAEQLIGNGDMLLSMGSDMVRLQCPLIETSEVENVINFIASQPAFPEMMMLPEVKTEAYEGSGDLDDLDPLFEEAARIIVQHQQGSTSLIQRRMKLGYNRAGRIMDQLELAGIVGQSEGSKARAVLIPDEYALEQFLTNLINKKH